MKIYEKIVIDISSGETISERSYNYNGPLALCGSSGGGGGSSGKVSYAQFMEDRLEIMLDACIVDTDTARAGNSPYFAAVAYDPSTRLTAMETSVGTFNTLVDSLVHKTDWDAAVTQAKTTIDALYDPAAQLAEIDASITLMTTNIDELHHKIDWASVMAQAKLTIEALYNPATQLTAMDSAICAFNTVVDALNSEGDWASAVAQAKTTIDALIDDTYINAEVASFADVVDDQIDNITIPKFQRGMQDINAVQSSSYVLGEALIYGMRDRDVAKYQSELRMKAVSQRNEMIMKSASEMVNALLQRVEFEKKVVDTTIVYNSKYIDTKLSIDKSIAEAASGMIKNLVQKVEFTEKLLENVILANSTHIKTELSINEMFLGGASQMLQNYMQRVDFEKAVLHYSMEYNRMSIAASKDEDDRNIQFDELDARWDLEMWQYSANVLASIAGGVAISPSGNRPSQAQSAIGGTLSGAAAGAMMTPANPLIGGAAGGVLGLASSFL